jgi:hypothetical protein
MGEGLSASWIRRSASDFAWAPANAAVKSRQAGKTTLGNREFFIGAVIRNQMRENGKAGGQVLGLGS